MSTTGCERCSEENMYFELSTRCAVKSGARAPTASGCAASALGAKSAHAGALAAPERMSADSSAEKRIPNRMRAPLRSLAKLPINLGNIDLQGPLLIHCAHSV